MPETLEYSAHALPHKSACGRRVDAAEPTELSLMGFRILGSFLSGMALWPPGLTMVYPYTVQVQGMPVSQNSTVE